MSEGYIDSASIYEIVSCLRYKQPNECNSWALRSAIEVTCALINTHHLKMAPAPSIVGAASGPYGYLTEKLADVVACTRPTPEVEKKALQSTKRRAREKAEDIRNVYDNFRVDQINFYKWLDLSIAQAWTEHSARLGGLFNKEFIPQISHVLNVPVEVLYDIYQQSCDLEILRMYIRQRPDNENFKIMQDAYFVSALIRGLYHDYIAKYSYLQIMHHPIRLPILPTLRGKPRNEFKISNVELNLSNIILAGAYTEVNHNKRISSWAENVLKARKAALSGIIDLQSKDYEDVALETAIKAAKQINIRTYPKWIEKTLDAAVALGIGILTSFVLVGWESLIVSGASYAISRKTEFGKGATRLIYERKDRLLSLSKFGPGRVIQTWDS